MEVIRRQDQRWGSSSLLLLVLAVFLIACDDEESKRHLSVLKQLAADTAVYPGFKQVKVDQRNTHGRAMLFLYYNSPATYDEVKTFYSKTLIANGWELYPKERRRGILYYQDDSAVVFRKGDYQIAILRESPDQVPTARNFVVLYVWEQP